MEWLNKISVCVCACACVCTCGCTCLCGYVYNDYRASLTQSYILLHVATSPLGKALGCSYLLHITSLIFRHSPGCFQSWRNGGGPASCSVDELTDLPTLNCRTGICLPLATPLPFPATSKCPQSSFSHPTLQDTPAKSAYCRPSALLLLLRRSWLRRVSAGL